MKEHSNYVKRSQRDYSMSLKLQIVSDIEKGFISITQAKKQYGIQARSTVVQWLIKFGNFDWENLTPIKMIKTPEQKIMELEAQVKLLEKQKAFLERQAFVADKKAILFDMMIDLAEKEYHIDIRKNSVPEQSPISDKENEKQ